MPIYVCANYRCMDGIVNKEGDYCPNCLRVNPLSQYNIDLLVATRYAKSLLTHLSYIVEYGRKLGVPDAQLTNHDLSKWSLEEFPAYANFFEGEKSLENKIAFDAAFKHHLECGTNLHHWLCWKRGTTLERMPYHYVLEMVADWFASSMAYTGKEDMTLWLEANLPKIQLHHETWADLNNILQGFDYPYYMPTVYNEGLTEYLSASVLEKVVKNA
jgi:hypothetical protein